MRDIDHRSVAVVVYRGLFAGVYYGLVYACLLRYKTVIINDVREK